MSWLISISFHNHSLSFAKGEGSPLMQATVTPQQRQAAKREIVRQLKQGASTHEAQVCSTVPMHRTIVYRLLKSVQREEESGFADGQHGHPVKLRGEVFTCLIEHCQANPCVSSSTVQRLLQERFGVSISVSQLNRVRARLGLTRKPVPREKKPKTSFAITPGYHEQAGGLLLLEAATETGLLIQLELNHWKDQVMTVCKVALANLAMWVRDHYFPPFYAQATWKRLLPFFQLPGTITQDAQMIRVELRPFNDRALNRDLEVLCERVNQASPRLPDGRGLSFTIRSTCCTLVAQDVAKIP